MSLEAAPKPNWAEYMYQLEHLTVSEDWDQLEALFLEEHPLLPGELEAFKKLTEGLHRPPRVELDDTGFHVVPKTIEDDT